LIKKKTPKKDVKSWGKLKKTKKGRLPITDNGKGKQIKVNGGRPGREQSLLWRK